MESTARDRLRRDVRRAVHQACLHRFERDRVTAPIETELDLGSIRSAHGEAAVTEEEIGRWIVEDEGEFERALLISDLVARRVNRAGPVQAAAAPSTASASSPAPATRPARQAPSIATLLDDMFAQPPARSGR